VWGLHERLKGAKGNILLENNKGQFPGALLFLEHFSNKEAFAMIEIHLVAEIFLVFVG